MRHQPHQGDTSATGSRRDGAASFAPTRIGGGRRASSSAIALVALAALVLVGVGVAGRVMTGASGGPGPGSSAVAVRPSVLPAQSPPGDGGGGFGNDVGGVPPPVAFTVSRGSSALEVHGTVGLRAVAFLRIDVVDATGALQASHPLPVDDPDGGLRPAYTRTFLTTFPVVSASSTWPLWVKVTAFDAVGGMIGAITEALVPGTAFLKVPLKVNQMYLR